MGFRSKFRTLQTFLIYDKLSPQLVEKMESCSAALAADAFRAAFGLLANWLEWPAPRGLGRPEWRAYWLGDKASSQLTTALSSAIR